MAKQSQRTLHYICNMMKQSPIGPPVAPVLRKLCKSCTRHTASLKTEALQRSREKVRCLWTWVSLRSKAKQWKSCQVITAESINCFVHVYKINNVLIISIPSLCLQTEDWLSWLFVCIQTSTTRTERQIFSDYIRKNILIHTHSQFILIVVIWTYYLGVKFSFMLLQNTCSEVPHCAEMCIYTISVVKADFLAAETRWQLVMKSSVKCLHSFKVIQSKSQHNKYMYASFRISTLKNHNTWTTSR